MGFTQAGLAALFNQSSSSASPPSSKNKTGQSSSFARHRTALIAAGITSLAFFLVGTILYTCRRLRRHLFGWSSSHPLELGGQSTIEVDGASKRQEMEANETAVVEIMDADLFCELPANVHVHVNDEARKLKVQDKVKKRRKGMVTAAKQGEGEEEGTEQEEKEEEGK